MVLVAPANLLLAYGPPLALLAALRRAAILSESNPRIVTHGFLAGIPAVLPAVAALAAVAYLTAYLPGLHLPGSHPPGVPRLLWRSFGLSAGIEELSKLAALAVIVRLHRSNLTAGVIVLAGAAAGAGFAFVENSLYLIDMPRIIGLRLLTAGLLHVAAAAISGYGIALVAYRYGGMLPWVVCAILLHGAYNLLIDLGGLAALWAPLVPVLAALVAWSRYNRAVQFRLPGRRTRAYPDS